MSSLDKLADSSKEFKLPRIGDTERTKTNNYTGNTTLTHNDKRGDNCFSVNFEDTKIMNTNVSTGWDKILEETSLFDVPSKTKESKKVNLKLSANESSKISAKSTVNSLKYANLPEFRNYFPNFKSIEKKSLAYSFAPRNKEENTNLNHSIRKISNSPTKESTMITSMQIPSKIKTSPKINSITNKDKKKNKIEQQRIRGLKFEQYTNRKDMIDEKKFYQYHTMQTYNGNIMETSPSPIRKAVDFDKYTNRKEFVNPENLPSPGYYKPKFDLVFIESNKTLVDYSPRRSSVGKTYSLNLVSLINKNNV